MHFFKWVREGSLLFVTGNICGEYLLVESMLTHCAHVAPSLGPEHTLVTLLLLVSREHALIALLLILATEKPLPALLLSLATEKPLGLLRLTLAQSLLEIYLLS